MPKAAFTAEFVRDLPHTETRQKEFWDSNLTGLGVRVGTRSKKWVVVGYVAGKKVWVTQGPAPMTYDQAKKWAKGHLGDMAKGINPNAKKTEQRASTLTLAEALDSTSKTPT